MPSPVEMDDLEFEDLCDKIYRLWEKKTDTAGMAIILNTSEAKIDHVLWHIIEALNDAKEEMQPITNGERADG